MEEGKEGGQRRRNEDKRKGRKDGKEKGRQGERKEGRTEDRKEGTTMAVVAPRALRPPPALPPQVKGMAMGVQMS